jgi:hypothetical protein
MTSLSRGLDLSSCQIRRDRKVAHRLYQGSVLDRQEHSGESHVNVKWMVCNGTSARVARVYQMAVISEDEIGE